MANQEDAEKGKCCSGCHCCGGRAFRALALVVVGGVLGYLLGGHCAYKKGMCPMSAAPTAQTSAPVAPQK
jgi:hypothetical protein